MTRGGGKGLPKTFYLSSMPRLGALEMLVGLGLIGRQCKTTEPIQDPVGEAPSFLCSGTSGPKSRGEPELHLQSRHSRGQLFGVANECTGSIKALQSHFFVSPPIFPQSHGGRGVMATLLQPDLSCSRLPPTGLPHTHLEDSAWLWFREWTGEIRTWRPLGAPQWSGGRGV